MHTLDIRQALIHVFRGGRFSEIPGMNRNVIYDNVKKLPIPPRVPTPPPPKPATPRRTFIPWVPYDKAKVKDVKISKSKLDFPFDLYIDAVRFVPDNATFLKVCISALYSAFVLI